MNMPSVTTCGPRCFDRDISLCHTGIVDKSPPKPSPIIKRETNNCGSWKELAIIIAPIAASSAEPKIVFLRPNLSPSGMQLMLPKIPPIWYVETTMPVFGKLSGCEQLRGFDVLFTFDKRIMRFCLSSCGGSVYARKDGDE
jgi:hypothetical protein